MIPVIAGPTAVGKTKIAIQLALQLNAEIISCDSRQIYRQMNIGTAKPSPSELAQVRHHLINEMDLDQPYSAGIFATMAEERIQDIHHRGKLPLVVGGSTLYLHALMQGLADIPDVDSSIRDRLNQRLLSEGAENLYQELLNCDPEFAATLDRTKSQRILRGLEVFQGTGRPLSSFHSERSPRKYAYQLVVLDLDREILYQRIDARVDEMIENGLQQEASDLFRQHKFEDTPALRTIGYQEFFDGNEGSRSGDDICDLIKRNTRRYAKRQLTWLRRYEEARWIPVDRLNQAELVQVLSGTGYAASTRK